MKWHKKKVLVYGLGKSGIAASALLLKQGARVLLYDGNENLDKEKIKKELKIVDSMIFAGEFPMDRLEDLDLAVVSPGVSLDLPEILELKEKDIPIIGEIELAYICGRGDVFAITGTNGKTTTTTLLGEIVKAYHEDTFVVGNIGSPYTAIAGDTKKDSCIVVEVSSFQLETIEHFHPKISGILNITPDHLNRHHTMEAYEKAKERITENQQEQDWCILNYEDERLRRIAETTKAKVLFFSSKQELSKGIFLRGDAIVLKDEKEQVLLKTGELQVIGTHNYENVMAAIGMAYAYKIPIDLIVHVLKSFAGVAHRIEYVGEYRGVVYYNDSKGTNPDAGIKAVKAMRRPTILIGGGYDKDSSYKEWIDSMKGSVRKLILVGETKEKIAAEAKAAGFLDYQLTDSFDEAVRCAVSAAKKGEAVLLSPACASWDMFDNYEDRGNRFKELVAQLAPA